jgi:hypothetical protein
MCRAYWQQFHYCTDKTYQFVSFYEGRHHRKYQTSQSAEFYDDQIKLNNLTCKTLVFSSAIFRTVQMIYEFGLVHNDSLSY